MDSFTVRRCQHFLKETLLNDSSKGLHAEILTLLKTLDEKLSDQSNGMTESEIKDFKRAQSDLLRLCSPPDIKIVSSTTAVSSNNSRITGYDVTAPSNFEVVEESNVGKITSLLQKQKDLSVQEVETEKLSHELLSQELVEMTDVLKSATMKMQETISSQNLKLDSIQKSAEENVSAILEQRAQVCTQFQYFIFPLIYLLVDSKERESYGEVVLCEHDIHDCINHQLFVMLCVYSIVSQTLSCCDNCHTVSFD